MVLGPSVVLVLRARDNGPRTDEALRTKNKGLQVAVFLLCPAAEDFAWPPLNHCMPILSKS